MNIQIRQLEGDGDFRSPECRRFLKEADIVVTNPPFSLLREFFEMLFQEDKKFLIVGTINALFYKILLPEIRRGTVRTGLSFRNQNKNFILPDGSLRNLNGIEWYSNLHDCWPKPLTLTQAYNPEKYPKYDNYDAIEVAKTKNIPKDYYGVMGVPISFYDKYNPSQFEILGSARPFINGKKKYARLLIKRR